MFLVIYSIYFFIYILMYDKHNIVIGGMFTQAQYEQLVCTKV